MPAHLPEPGQQPCCSQAKVRFARLITPGQRRAQIVVVEVQTAQPGGLMGATDLAHDDLRASQVVPGVSLTKQGALLTRVELLQRIIADRLEHAEAWILSISRADMADQALFGQRLNGLERIDAKRA